MEKSDIFSRNDVCFLNKNLGKCLGDTGDTNHGCYTYTECGKNEYKKLFGGPKDFCDVL
jgi:hypothetical protein